MEKTCPRCENPIDETNRTDGKLCWDCDLELAQAAADKEQEPEGVPGAFSDEGLNALGLSERDLQ